MAKIPINKTSTGYSSDSRQPTDHEAEFELAAAKRLRVSRESLSSVTGKLAGHGHEVNAVWLKATDKGTVKSQQQQDEGPVYSEEEGLQEEDTPSLFHTYQPSSFLLDFKQKWLADMLFEFMHGFRPDEGVGTGITKHETSTAKIHETSDSKTKQQLQEQVEALALQNAQKDAQIAELKQHLKVKTQKGCTGTLKYAGGTCSLLHNPEGSLILLGNGNYGRVYKGRCNNTGRHLAVKVVQDLTKKAADALEKEVKQLSDLKHHDRIVTYLGICYAKHPRFDVESLYVFMEFMPGGSLSSYISEKGPLTERIMWRFTRQILDGVEYLHKCDVIHRDIKGSNIMCDSSHKNIKLADFGSAKKICSESLDKDKTKYIYGTAPWAAPEMLRGEKAQRGSDIWSVGATLVEMLTGETPYKNENFDSHLAIIFKVGSYRTNPLMSLKKSGQILTTNVETFLDGCFKRIAANRSSASTLLRKFWPRRYFSKTIN